MKTPALDLWRKELLAGARTKRTFDALWRAACCEAAALEFQRIPNLAAAYLEDARQIIRKAARESATVVT